MKQTILIQGGASGKGPSICENYLEKEYRVICLDDPEKIYNVQHLLSLEEFVFKAYFSDYLIDIGEEINFIIVVG